MSLDPIKTRKFRETLAQKPREELLRIIKMQDQDTYDEVMRIEHVFRNDLSHLKWASGEPITERDLTNEELALLIDEPFSVSKDLLEMGINAEKQKELHLMSDPVMWGKTFLRDADGMPIHSRAYQILVLRDPSNRRVMRWGRRLGKTFAMTLLMMHKCMTKPNYKVVVVAAQIKYVKLIYDEVVKLIENNEYLSANVKRYAGSPSPEVDFHTGSTIKFFTAGTSTGSKSDSTRGQEADLIILDELDYMHPDDLIAIMALLQDTRKNQSKKILVGASTPTGAHEVFYDWCTRSPIFKEFYFPAYVNPFWDDDMEQEQRQLYKTQNSYTHEIEADWGDNAEGVYPRRYLDIAFDRSNNWEYVDHRLNGNSDYFIGVDWDKYGAGTNIVVLERFDKQHIDRSLANKIRVCFREEIPRDQFTYSKAVARVIDLNDRFNPKYIYVDRGAGEMQIEMLHEAGIAYPFSGLGKKVKGISFKEIIETRDPFSLQLVRKETKPFMVDNLYQLLENELVMMPFEDEELYHQLLSYIVLRTSQNGHPIFDSTNGAPDHAHDALLLACLAFTENYGDFFNISLATEAKPISNSFFMPVMNLPPKQDEKSGTLVLSTSSAYEPQDKEDNPRTEVGKVVRAMTTGTSRRRTSGSIRRKSF